MQFYNKEKNPLCTFLPRSGCYLLFVLFLIGIGAGRIISTYQVFTNTYDEPAHIACGLEWLELGSYNYDVKHPPLGRIAVALGPLLNGSHISKAQRKILAEVSKERAENFGYRQKDYRNIRTAMWNEGKNILYRNNNYFRTLALARMGMLPFFLLATIMVWFWCRRLFDDVTAIAATILFSSLPTVLAHSSLATTDMAITATFYVFLFTYTLWLDQPTFLRSLSLGIAVGLAILSKLTALLFMPACAFGLLLWRLCLNKKDMKSIMAPVRRRIFAFGFTILASFLLIWACYHFSLSSITSIKQRPHGVIDRVTGTEGTLKDLTYKITEATILPAAELLAGIFHAQAINNSGHRSYLLGERINKGRWYFFPVVFAVKTPLPFIFFTVIGMFILFRKAWYDNYGHAVEPGICAICILLACIFVANYNLGVRHILPVYPLFAIMAGFGAVSLWNVSHTRLLCRTVTIILILWQLTTSFLSHPDYLAYFNELAGKHPEKILVDSDLDWGQDLNRLSKKLQELGIKRVAIAYHGWANLNQHDLPKFELLLPNQPTTGWIAISISKIKKFTGYSWLEKYQPVTIVGKSIWLYNITDENS